MSDKITTSEYTVRGVQVMLSHDLAELFQVDAKALNQQVKKNPGRFPEHYMFRVTEHEYQELVDSNATLERGQHSSYRPFAFTEYGVLMLSSLLIGERAEKVNILLIDTFVTINNLAASGEDVSAKLNELEEKVAGKDNDIKSVFARLKEFIVA